MAAEGGTKGLAGELAAPVYGAFHTVAASGVFQRPDTRFHSPVAVHVKALDVTVKAGQHCRRIEFSIRGWDRVVVCQELLGGGAWTGWSGGCPRQMR